MIILVGSIVGPLFLLLPDPSTAGNNEASKTQP